MISMEKNVTKLMMLTCILAPAGAASASDYEMTDCHQTYFKWFLEELELGRCNRWRSGRGVATYSPVESPDRPPAHFPRSWYSTFRPYYSRVIPSSTRWSPTVHAPYYRGYLLTGRVSREPHCVYVATPDRDAASYPSDRYGAYAVRRRIFRNSNTWEAKARIKAPTPISSATAGIRPRNRPGKVSRLLMAHRSIDGWILSASSCVDRVRDAYRS